MRCLMSVSMTAEMTTSQNRRSDSPTAAVWIMFTCCQAAGIFLIALPRHRTRRILSVKPHVGQTLQKFLKDFLCDFPSLSSTSQANPLKQEAIFCGNEGVKIVLLMPVSLSQVPTGRDTTALRASMAHLAPPAPLPAHTPECSRGTASSRDGGQPRDPAGNASGKDPAELTPNTQLTWHKAWHGPGAK